MIEIDTKRRQNCWGYHESNPDDPFQLIDTKSDPNEKSKEIFDALHETAKSLRKLMNLIEESEQEVYFGLECANNTHHDEMSLMGYVALLTSCIDLKGPCSKGGRLKYGFRTEYEMNDCILHVLLSLMKHSDYQPEWFKAICKHWTPVGFYGNERRVELRICSLALNLIGICNWKDTMDSENDEIEAYGRIAISERMAEKVGV